MCVCSANIYAHIHICTYVGLHTYNYIHAYIYVYITTYTHISYCSVSGGPRITQFLTAPPMLWLPATACQMKASWGKGSPWILSAEISFLGHRVRRRRWICRGKSRLSNSDSYFPTERHFKYKSGRATNGLRPFTGSPSLLEQR